MSNEIDEDIELMDKARKEKAESKMARIVMLTNHIGKTRPKKLGRKKNKLVCPRSFVNARRTRFVNYGAAIGMTDDEYRTWIKTGKMPAKESE